MNARASKISVVTVCFNAAATIEKTILSVVSQSHPIVEYVVVDGASTDGTLKIVAKYSERIDNLISEKDRGIFDAMNKGVATATGDVVYFLNADDSFVDDRVLEDVARAFEQDATRMLVYGNVVLKDGPPGVLNFPARAFRKRSVSEFLHNSFCHQAVFVRRELFAQLGPFDLQYRYSADYEWIIRAFKRDAGRDFFFLDRNIANYYFLGRSQQHAAVTTKEVHRMQFRHFASVEFAWYFFRYVFLRKWKKRILHETY
ncbi:MAG: glycosyltransferase family 2 protein [Betaproteobacteria bacterium]